MGWGSPLVSKEDPSSISESLQFSERVPTCRLFTSFLLGVSPDVRQKTTDQMDEWTDGWDPWRAPVQDPRPQSRHMVVAGRDPDRMYPTKREVVRLSYSVLPDPVPGPPIEMGFPFHLCPDSGIRGSVWDTTEGGRQGEEGTGFDRTTEGTERIRRDGSRLSLRPRV